MVIKRGGEGSLVCTCEQTFALPAHKVKVADTTGAGDAFSAALTVCLGEGRSLVESARFANAAGAIAVTTFGTMPAMPTRSQVEALLHQRTWP